MSASDELLEQGYVVLPQVVPHNLLDILESRMQQDTRELLAFTEANGGNPRARGHLQQGPPPMGEYVFEEIVANEAVVALSRQILGDKFWLGFYNGNTNCPGSEVQGLHMDMGHLWTELPFAAPPSSLVINIPTGDCTIDNGAIELWPGSHLVSRGYGEDRQITDEMEQERRALSPPIQAVSQKGDILVRDGRLWHRGVPNPSDTPRQMIALIYHTRWLPRGRPLLFSQDCKDVVESDDVDCHVKLTDEPIDYLLGPTRAIYEQRKN
ncbi:MAG: phytanoyl-CoA dioxygenase family protein [Pseudomonadota bacterium]